MKVIGNRVYHISRCKKSSMQWAKENVSYSPDGALFLADQYDFAKGRQGRTWKLFSGQLLFTLVLKPDFSVIHGVCEDIAKTLNYLTMAISVGISYVLKDYGVGIKWPNDFIVQNKKAGGLLFETVWQGDTVEGIIIGFGLNVNNEFGKSDELFSIATSLKAVTGKHICLDDLREKILEKLDFYYSEWKNGKFDKIFYKWRSLQVLLGKRISVHQKDLSIVSGIMDDVLSNGNIVILCDDGLVREISFCMVDIIETGLLSNRKKQG